MGTLSPEEKKSLGQELTQAKTQITEAYEAKQRALSMDQINAQLNADIVDSSLESTNFDQGSFSLLANIRREVEEIFKSL
jgi:phenylalanyl-tRNA synthetase alpha subunit